jgi:hypothetical protein
VAAAIGIAGFMPARHLFHLSCQIFFDLSNC